MKKREIKRKLHNGILWGVSYLAFVLLLISASAIGVESIFHAVVMIASIGWLSLFALANKDRW